MRERVFNMMSVKSGWLRIGLLLWLFCSSTHGNAQQTIFNVPSADVTPKGNLFLQHKSELRPWEHGRFLGNTEYSAVGIGYNTELDATVFNINAPATHNVTLGVGFKTALPVCLKKFPNREFKLTVGEMIP